MILLDTCILLRLAGNAAIHAAMRSAMAASGP
jgi:hypothetical protein